MRTLAAVILLSTLVPTTYAQEAALTGPSALWQRSYEQEARGRYDLAIQALDGLSSRDREGYLYLSRHAWLLYASGEHALSVAAYRRAIRRAPNAIEPKVALLLPLMALRRWQEAEPVARDILQQSPHHQLAERRLALILYRLGRFEEAERHYRAVLERYPSDLEMQTGIGWCRLRRGASASAQSAFSRALRFAPRDVSARAGLAASSEASH